MSSQEVTVYSRAADLSRVQADEVFIVIMVLFVWVGAVYIFFNQWGKSKSTIPIPDRTFRTLREPKNPSIDFSEMQKVP